MSGRFWRPMSLQLTRKESTVRPKRWIRAFVLTLTAALPVVSVLGPATVALAADDVNSVSHLVEIILGNSTPVAQRNDAALRLVGNDSPQAHEAVRSCLQNSGKPLAQAAVADAVAQSANPDPSLIPILSQLLGSSRSLTEKAAAALANYQGNHDAFVRLTSFIDITKNPNGVRTDAIKAMGSLIDRSAAEYLIRLLSAPNQNASIQTEAMKALTELTGISSFGSDIRQWQQWWASVEGRNQDQFQAMLLETRAGQFERAKKRDAQLVTSTKDLLEKYYYDLPDARAKPGDRQKSDVLLLYLDDPSPDVRNVGIQLVDDNYIKAPPIEPVRKKLFAMISDVDDSARYNDVKFLLTLNDRAALMPLIDQLNVEQNLGIKKKIANVLAKLEDPAAAPALLKLLHDPQIEASTAAAQAFFPNLGAKLRQTDPKKADDISQEIRNLLGDNAKQPGTAEFRAACLFALGALRDKASFNTFNEYLQPNETNDVRRAALLGLGNLGNNNADQIVANQLRDNNDKTVRLEAARALQSVATPGQADQIFNRMNVDPDEDVKAALWIAFQNLYPKESPEDLEHWQSQFDNDPDKKLVTLKKLGDALQARGDKQQVALNQQNLATALLAVKPPRTQEAIDNLQAALDYWHGPGNGDDLHLETLVEQLMDAQLLDGRYADAVAFASKQIAAKPEYRGALSLKIVNKADDLLTRENNAAGAGALINEALKMTPPIDPKYNGRIQEMQGDLKQRGTAPAAP